jgi:hypothetical protein
LVEPDVPLWKGITSDAVADVLAAGCAITSVAVMVVLSVVPSTRTGWPVVTTLAEAGLVPFT